VQSGLNFNPYFPGTGIAMARVLYDGLVDYEDGTPATSSQMAKDVVEFLNWAAEPEHDRRKLMGWKIIGVTTILFGLSVWVKRYVEFDLDMFDDANKLIRYKWAGMKTRKLVYNPQSNGPAPRFQIPKK
jgi:ubiquinol-cytochrome c reductase cytochrome c1 subunit